MRNIAKRMMPTHEIPPLTAFLLLSNDVEGCGRAATSVRLFGRSVGCFAVVFFLAFAASAPAEERFRDTVPTIYREAEDGTRREVLSGGFDVERMVSAVLEVDRLALRGDRSLWETRVTRDVTLRTVENREELLGELEAAIVELTQPAARLTRQSARVPVYVATGPWVAAGEGRDVRLGQREIVVGDLPEDPEVRPVMGYTGSPDRFLTKLGTRVGRIVVPDGPLGLRKQYSFVWYPNAQTTDADYPFDQSAADPEAVLRAITRQTGLTFREDTREIDLFTLTATPSDD